MKYFVKSYITLTASQRFTVYVTILKNPQNFCCEETCLAWSFKW